MSFPPTPPQSSPPEPTLFCLLHFISFFKKYCYLLDFVSKHAAVLRLNMHVPEASGKLVSTDSKWGRVVKSVLTHTDWTSELGGHGVGDGDGKGGV